MRPDLPDSGKKFLWLPLAGRRQGLGHALSPSDINRAPLGRQGPPAGIFQNRRKHAPCLLLFKNILGESPEGRRGQRPHRRRINP
jgi:hypothetical protein